MKNNTFENYFFRMIRELAILDSSDKPIKPFFNILEKFKAKLEKYSVDVFKKFPEIDFYKNSPITTDSYHFKNADQSIDVFIALFEPDSHGKHSVRIIIEYMHGNQSPITFTLR